MIYHDFSVFFYFLYTNKVQQKMCRRNIDFLNQLSIDFHDFFTAFVQLNQKIVG